MRAVVLNLSFVLLGVFALGCEGLPDSTALELAAQGGEMFPAEGATASVSAESKGDRGAFPRRERLVEFKFGRMVYDPYRWMENPDDPELVEWFEAKNVQSDHALDGPLFEALKLELAELLQVTKASSTRLHGIMRQTEHQHSRELRYRRMRPATGMSPEFELAIPSTGGSYEVVLNSDAGNDLKRLEIIDLQSGMRLDDILMVKWPQVFWDDDEQSFLYVTSRDARLGHVTDGIFRHRLGTSQAADTLLYQSPVPGLGVILYPLGDKLAIVHDDGQGMSIGWFDDQSGEITPVVEDLPGPIYPFTADGQVIYTVRYSEAPLGEIVSLDLSDGAIGLVVPQGDLAIDRAAKIGDNIYLSYVDNAASALQYFNTTTQTMTPVELPREGQAYLREYNGQLLLYLTDYTHGYFVYLHDAVQNELVLLGQSDPPPFELEAFRTYYRAHNDQEIPIWVVKRPDTPLTPQTPMLIYGYGGFAANTLPNFDVTHVPWYARGGACAFVTLPGGLEYGEPWHQAGAGHNKINVFEDFAAAAQHLIDEGYTSPSRLVANGGSNGGLLVGATVNLYPQLFGAAVPEVGVMDMTRFALFTAGKWWVEDYGDRDVAADFHNLLSISPVHNIRYRPYPATLVMTADFDDRVVPAHSFKYAAQLEHHQRGTHPILLHTARWASHGRFGTSDEQIKAHAKKLAFMIKALQL